MHAGNWHNIFQHKIVQIIIWKVGTTFGQVLDKYLRILMRSTKLFEYCLATFHMNIL